MDWPIEPAVAREGDEAKGRVLAVDGRDGRIDQNECCGGLTGMDDSKIVSVIVAGEAGGNRGLKVSHKAFEESGPVRFPHGNDRVAA